MRDGKDRRALASIEVELLALHHDVRVHASRIARSASSRAIPNRPTKWADFDAIRKRAEECGEPSLYVPRVDELELEHALIGTSKAVRQRASRARWGDGTTSLVWNGRDTTLVELARAILARDAWAFGPRPASAPIGARARRVVDDNPTERLARFAHASGLRVDVRFEPELVADAASGEHVLYLRPKDFRVGDLIRLGAHEVHGHLVAAANAREQPLSLLRIGCASSWEDQEGVALVLEQRAGALDESRLRTLAARVLAVVSWFEGATETDACRTLVELGVEPDCAATASRRAFRQGGTARDLAYLTGYARVAVALDEGSATLDELRMGRVSLAALPALRDLAAEGLVAPPRHRPSLAISLRETFSGTSLATSPPRRAASFTKLEET